MKENDRAEVGQNAPWIEKNCGAFTTDEHKRILVMLNDYERRQWLVGYIGRVAKWITTVGTAIVIGQQLWTKWLTK